MRKDNGSIFKWEYWLNSIYHKTFGLLLTSRFRGHTLDVFQRQELFQFVRGVVFDKVTGVGEGNDGVGHVLTEDDHEVARVPDEPSKDTLRDFLDFSCLKMRHQPTKHCLVVNKDTCVIGFFSDVIWWNQYHSYSSIIKQMLFFQSNRYLWASTLALLLLPPWQGIMTVDSLYIYHYLDLYLYHQHRE